MRLLHTTTIELSSFDDDDSIPPYAILSHTWGNAEISFHDLLNYAESKQRKLEGYQKIRSCCAIAAAAGHEYVWIDTCCIDKTSSAELTEAINSMYRWYQEAHVCYAYLADFRIGDHGLTGTMKEEAFRKSRWFTRGWTLQELLAPDDVVFYDKNWREFGSKSSLIAQISLATGIQRHHIYDVNEASAAQKMSWASKRQTRRVEDMAYSLMGIFDVNMPLLYGEGKKAFIRLQHEIVKISNDESLFAWTDAGLVESGLFAQSPKAFAESGNVVQISSDHCQHIYRAPYMVTNRGLAIEALASRNSSSTSILDRRFAFLPLNCERTLNGIWVVGLAIELGKVSRDEFIRSSPGKLDSVGPEELDRLQRQIEERSVGLVYVRPKFIPCISHEQRLSLFIDSSSLSKRKLRIVGSYNCGPELRCCALSNETLWRITLRSGESFAATLVQGYLDTWQRFGIMIHTAESEPCLSLIALSTAENFHEVMDGYKSRRDYQSSARPAPIKLQNNQWVSMALVGKEVGVGGTDYLAEFVPTGEDDILTLPPRGFRYDVWNKRVVGM